MKISDLPADQLRYVKYLIPPDFKSKEHLHRLVIEKALGRKLEKGEWVHHKNLNHNDNRLENLEVMGANIHQQYHAFLRNLKKYKFNPPECIKFSS